jgi:hypothetical protein
MISGAYWGGIWRPAASGGTTCLSLSLRGSGVMPGQGAIPEVMRWRPQQDSNLRSRLRRPLLSPLSYGGYATWERVPANEPSLDTEP